MTKRERMERRRRRQRIRRIRMAIKIFIYTLIAVLIGVVVWAVASRFIKPEEADKTIPSVDAVTEESAVEEVTAVKSPYTGTGGRNGWNVDENGWWYLNDDETIFTSGWQTIDGNEYYFDEYGYMATGWKQVDGEYYLFGQDGLMEPDATEKLVALTYDDGPSNHTDRLLDCLVENGAKATFFVVGTQIEEFPEVLKRTEELGMEIGSHTYDHPYLKQISAADIQTTMDKNETLITSILGHGTTIMRPTGGAVNDTIRANVNRPMILWDIDTLDWDTRDAQSVADKVLNDVQDGSIILMHDLYEATVEATEIFLPELVSRGYRMVTVSELAQLRGITLQNGQEYSAFYPPQQEESGDDVVEPSGEE